MMPCGVNRVLQKESVRETPVSYTHLDVYKRQVNEENEIMMITTEGIIIRLQCSDISILGRITSGVKLINLSDGVTVASFAKVREKEEDKNSEKTEESSENVSTEENSNENTDSTEE